MYSLVVAIADYGNGRAPETRWGEVKECSSCSDNIRVLECPAKLVRRLIRRLSGDSIGVPFLSSFFFGQVIILCSNRLV